jgi:hypothetical protein
VARVSDVPPNANGTRTYRAGVVDDDTRTAGNGLRVAGESQAPPPAGGWYRRHLYLRTSTPEPVVVGGVKGVRFDVVGEDLPEGYRGYAGRTA